MADISAKDVKALRDHTGAGMMDCKRALADAEGDTDKALELLRERGLAKAGKRAGRATSEGSVGIALSGASAGLVELGCETDFVAKTDEFQTCAAEVASAVAEDASVQAAEQALAATLGSGTVEERVSALATKVGENVQLKRASRLAVEGGFTGGYVHAGGKLGVIVGLRTSLAADAAGALAKDIAMHIAATDPTPIAVDRDGVPADMANKERELLRRQAEQSGKPENVIERMVEGRMNKFYQEYCLLEQAFVKDPDRSVGDLLGDAGEGAGVTGFIRFRVGESEAE